MTDSGIRRIRRKFSAWFKKLAFSVLATRRNSDGKQSLDPSANLFRLVMTIVAVTVCPWTRPYLGLPPDDNRDTIKRLERVEQSVESLRAQMTFFVQGFQSFRPPSARREK